MEILEEFAIRKLNIALALALTVLFAGMLGSVTYVFALSTSTFNQTINAGSLAVDIVDGSFVTVGSPAVTLNAVTFAFGSQTATGTFGTATEQIYITNPDAADNGWSVTVAASSTTSTWDSAGTDFDFNDASSTVDGPDGDSFAGQMTIDPSTNATTATSQCTSCTLTGISLGTATSFNEGTVDTITIVTGASGSDDIGDWDVQNVDVSQVIPGEQPAASDYTIDMILTIAAT